MAFSLLIALIAAQGAAAAEPSAEALAAYRQGRCAEARPLLEAILADHPHDVTFRKLLAQCLLRSGSYAEARAQLEAALADSPEDGDAQEALRRTLAAMQAPEEARQEELLSSREAASAHLETQQQFHTAETLLAEGRRAQGERLLTGIVSRDASFGPATQRLAEVYSGSRRFGEAARLYRRLYEQDPTNLQWLLRAARNLDWGEQAPDAIETYKAYLARRPGDDQARLWLADALRGFGLCHEGLPEYTRLLAARPEDPDLHLRIALCHDQLGHADLAIEEFLKVLELDPHNEVALEARALRERDFDELPFRRAYAAIEAGDLAAAARWLEEFVRKHPDRDDALRDLADVYAWDGRYDEAEQRYREYLRRQPDADPVLRALARVQSWSGRLAEARASYELLISRGDARPSDLEGLVEVLVWADELEAAEPYARQLLELDPQSQEAEKALRQLRERRALVARERAEQLEQQARFREARAAYQDLLRAQGPDPQIELRLCDLLSWGGEHAAAAEAYESYLREHPGDPAAELGLANSLAWKGEPAAAVPHYRKVLARRPVDGAALLGLAQSLDASGRDPFEVLAAYERAVAANAGGEAARQGLADARRRVAPVLSLDTRGFADSDDFRVSMLEASSRLRFPHSLWLRPVYRLGLYRQTRSVAGDDAAVERLNARLEERGGRYTGNTLGVRAGLGDERLQGFGEVGYTSYGPGLSGATAQLEARVQVDRTGSAAVDFRHDYAITEVNTVASLAAGVRADVLQGSLDQTLDGWLRLWGAGGLTWYSEGSLGGAAATFSPNRQYRLALGASASIGSGQLGYAFRQTGFRVPSPLYFSPEVYRVHSLRLALAGDHGVFGWGVDGEAGLADIDGRHNAEWALQGTARYGLSPQLRLTARGRLARSSGGLATVRPYRTAAFELGLERVF